MIDKQSIRNIRHDLKSDSAAMKLGLEMLLSRQVDEENKTLLELCLGKLDTINNNTSALLSYAEEQITCNRQINIK